MQIEAMGEEKHPLIFVEVEKEADSSIKITVRDNGVGMNEEIRNDNLHSLLYHQKNGAGID